MERTRVESTNIASVGYDAATMTLEVEFNSGAVYQFFDVPEQVYSELMGAGSKGGYFSQQVREQFRYVRL